MSFHRALAAAIAVGMLVYLSSCGGGPSKSPALDTLGIPGGAPYPGFRGGNVNGEKNFATLINEFTSARAETMPWVGAWWPFKANGIAARHSGSSSPAGKHDAARGLTRNAQGWESKWHGSGLPKIEGWWGHCNGWSVASALYPEPRETRTVNGVEFSPADIKALLTEAGMGANSEFFGNRVDFGQHYNNHPEWDVIPNMYFLVLTNYMGKLKQKVLIDRYTGRQVWNQPLAAYEFTYPEPADYLGAHPTAPNVYRINLRSRIWWASDEVGADELTEEFAREESRHFNSRELRMEVWLDGPVVFDGSGKITSSGNVVVTRTGDYFVGGRWAHQDAIPEDEGHPDYMWVPTSVPPPDFEDAEHNANPEVDIAWVLAHVVPGKDDPSVRPSPIPTAPNPSPTPSSSSSPRPTFTPIDPRPDPSPPPFPEPMPVPTPTST